VQDLNPHSFQLAPETFNRGPQSGIFSNGWKFWSPASDEVAAGPPACWNSVDRAQSANPQGSESDQLSFAGVSLGGALVPDIPNL